MDTALIVALGAVFVTVVPILISWGVSRRSAKKEDIATLQSSYAELQKTYSTENKRLNGELDKLRNENDSIENKFAAYKLECQSQIAELRKQLTLLLAKMPEPGAVVPMKLVDIATEKPLPVVAATTLQVEVVKPSPLLVALAEVAAKEAAEAAKKEEETK